MCDSLLIFIEKESPSDSEKDSFRGRVTVRLCSGAWP
jgi:hypothetical protein